jgi:hypothetical protein
VVPVQTSSSAPTLVHDLGHPPAHEHAATVTVDGLAQRLGEATHAAAQVGHVAPTPTTTLDRRAAPLPAFGTGCRCKSRLTLLMLSVRKLGHSLFNVCLVVTEGDSGLLTQHLEAAKNLDNYLI